MISGFNTDIVHDGTVYHVQTEDKGRSNPIIESLVYVGGQVVVSKRDEYADLVETEGTDQEIAERMDNQHQVLIAAIKSGRFDEQLKSLLDSGEVLVSSAEDFEAAIGARDATTESAFRRAEKIGDAIDTSITLDEVVLRYLGAESGRDRLLLAMDENGDLAMGNKAFLALKATSSQHGHAVVGAKISVKIISTIREPQVLIEGETDKDGEVFLNVQIPVLKDAAAALIISATSDLGKAELKYLL